MFARHLLALAVETDTSSSIGEIPVRSKMWINSACRGALFVPHFFENSFENWVLDFSPQLDDLTRLVPPFLGLASDSPAQWQPQVHSYHLSLFYT
jgi:hypothetical protein